MEDESGISYVITFWNAYATRSWATGQSFWLIDAEIYLRRCQSLSPEPQINVWYDAMVIHSEDKYEDFKLP